MFFHTVDFAIMLFVLVVLFSMAIYTRRYSVSVADFLVANRCAGRYLIAVASGAAGVGAVTIIAGMEIFHLNGFPAVWWGFIAMVIGMFVSLSGWVHYRYRQTRVLTMAQFVEIRYSKSLRVFMGVIAFVAGVINFGIFPSIISRFLIYFIGLPDNIYVFMIVMATVIGFALVFTFIGGQITILVTDFLQGILLRVLYIVVPVYLFFVVGWSRIIETLSAAPQGRSLINPFDTAEAGNFNIYYYGLGAFLTLYVTGAWQGSTGYTAAAIHPHEARMAQILNNWRLLPQRLLMVFCGICAYTVMRHPDFADIAQNVVITIQSIANPYLKEQMTPSVSLQQILPRGLMGFVATAMLCASISTHNTYMHSWGSIFVQDVIMPFKKTRLTPKNHLKLLRMSICGVAIFIFVFSLLFRQIEYIMMFFRITGAIFTGGAGSVIIGGLYWKRGKTSAAWSAMITGSTLSVACIIIKQMYTTKPFDSNIMNYIASQNSNTLTAGVVLLSIFLYIIISLIDKSPSFNLNKMLHRGKYAIKDEYAKKTGIPIKGFRALIGVTDDFSKGDKLFYYLSIWWTFAWVGVFAIGFIIYYAFGISMESWSRFWLIYVVLIALVGLIFSIAMTIGGIKDLKNMFRLLEYKIRDDNDDGSVIAHHNLADEPCLEEVDNLKNLHDKDKN